MKKTIHSITLMILMTIILASCWSVNQSEMDSENSSGTVEPFNTKMFEPTFSETTEPLNTPTAISELSPGKIPVIISYIKEVEGQRKIVSTALNFQSNYAPISVERGTDFRAQLAVDSDLNLYVIYGSRINYFSKLSVDGKIDTIELPYNWSMETSWAGNQLFIMANAHSMSVINTDLKITTLSPALNDFEDGVYNGNIRTIIDPSPTVIWTLELPVADETENYAFVRTLSLDTLTINEYKMKIPDTAWAIGSDSINQNKNQRAGTLIYTVDIQTEEVFLCYGDSREDEFGKIVNYFELELYASKTGETAASNDFACLNTSFHLRGNSIITMDFPEGYGATQVLGLNDLQPIFDVTPFLDMENYYENWIDSNGVYWQIVSKNRVTVLSSDLKDVISYSMPSNLPTDIIPGTTLLPAFLIEE